MTNKKDETEQGGETKKLPQVETKKKIKCDLEELWWKAKLRKCLVISFELDRTQALGAEVTGVP